MKTDKFLSNLNPSRSPFLRVGLIASLCLGVSATAFAKRGGGGNQGGGGGGQNPPPPEIGDLPVVSETGIEYAVTVLDGIDDASPLAPWATYSEVKVFLEDINKHGVACGEIQAPAEPGLRSAYGIIATASGGITQLDQVFEDALMSAPEFAGLYISGAWEINERGQIACDLSGDESGNVYIAVGDLTDGSLTLVNTVANSVYGWPAAGPARDLNEFGDVISYEGAYVGRGRKREFQPTYWLSSADGNGGWNTPVELAGVRGWPQINSSPPQLAYVADDATLRRWDLSLEEEDVIDDFSSLDSSFELNLRITDDGAVYYLKSVETSTGLQGYPVRWTLTGGLQALAGLQDPSAGPMVTIIDASKGIDGDETMEVLVGSTASTTFDLQVYHPDESEGVLYPLEVPGADTSGTFSYRPTAISRPDASGHGHVCGWANVSSTEKGAFILTPIAAP